MRGRLLFSLILITIITGCGSQAVEQLEQGKQEYHEKTKQSENAKNSVSEQSVEIKRFEPTVLATNLDIPWSIDKYQDTFYISQRNGSIVKIENGEATEQIIELDKVVRSQPEQGFMGFVLAPNFEETSTAYAYHTYAENAVTKNRVIQLQLENDVWYERKVILDSIPGSRLHNGGRIKIGPDQKLYVTTGDRNELDTAQDLETLSGKILRMELDGSIPEDNPFKNSYIYSYGHRNPQGLTWDDSGQMYSSEHGHHNGQDELNLIMPGRNYGWPVIVAGEKAAGMETPMYHTGGQTWAPSGIAYHQGRIYVATLTDSRIRVYDLETGKANIVFQGVGRMRDIYIEDDGTVYFISNNTDGRGDPKEEDDKLYQAKIILE